MGFERKTISNLINAIFTETNADKIRSMTDEELAEFLSNTFSHGYGKDSILNWLQEAVK